MSEENKDIKVNEEEKKALENQDTLANTLENRIPLPAKEKHYNSQNLYIKFENIIKKRSVIIFNF